MIDVHPSPLRYPGGKAFLTEFLAAVIHLNELSGGTYVEPFAGGAGAALKLLFGEHVRQILLNDADPRVFSFWKSILHETESFLKLVQDVPVNIETWKQQREINRDPDGKSHLELGFSTFFLNRTNRSGVFGAGPIGGHNQTGNYLLDVRFNRKELRRKIERIAMYSERIRISRKDAVELLKVEAARGSWDKQSTLVYLDPPYYEKGRRLYPVVFEEDQHHRLSQFLNNCGAFRWITSYDDVPFVHSLYAREKKVLFMPYFMHKVRVGRELIIASADCRLPRSYFEASESSSELDSLSEATG